MKFKTKGKGSTMLTSGLSMSDPFFGSMSFSIELSVTLISLKAYCETNADETASPNIENPIVPEIPLSTTSNANTSDNSNVVQGKVL